MLSRIARALTILVMSLPGLVHGDASSGILINEIWTGAPDWVELANVSSVPIDVSGWSIRTWSKGLEESAWENDPLVIPPASTIAPGGFLVISDADDTSSECILTAMEGFTCLLEDSTGVPIDSIVASGMFGEPLTELSAPALFFPPLPQRFWNDGIHRNSWTDSDTGLDWIVSMAGTPGQPNPGQSSAGCNKSEVSPVFRDCRRKTETAASTSGRQFATRHVIVLVLDGVRVSDGFDPGTVGRAPNMTEFLAARGCLDTDCINTGNPVTLPAHIAMTTGSWMMQGNNKYPVSNIFPENPTIFEYYRRHLELQGIPLSESADRCVQLYGKYGECSTMASSHHPLYGPAYGSVIRFPEMELNWPVEAPHKDMIVYRAVLEELRGRQPDLMLINLAQIDQRGHHGGWDGYEYSVRKADEFVAGIWREIQAQPYYRDSTTLIVTTDHGRHDDAHGGYHHHGCNCRGCRRTFCLVLGPDTPQGIRVDTSYETIDIAATAAALMGFDAPLCDGRFMTDMFVPADDPVDASAACRARDLSISASSDRVALTWMQRENTDWTGMHSLAMWGGPVWSFPAPLPYSPEGHATRWASCSLTPEGALVTAIVSHPMPSTGLETLSWYLRVTDTSTGRPILHARTGKMANRPAIFEWEGAITTLWSRYYDQPEPFPPFHSSIEMAIEDEPESIPRFSRVDSGLFAPGPPAFAQNSATIHAAYRNHEDRSWTIRYCGSQDAGHAWNVSGALLPVDRSRLAGDPSIGTLAGTVHIAWAEKTLPVGHWRIQCMSSFDDGISWRAPITLSDDSSDATEPLMIAANGRIIVAWISSQNARTGITGRVSMDGGVTFSAPVEWVPPSASMMARPVATRIGSDLVMAWIDLTPRIDRPIKVTKIEGIFP